MHFWFPKSQREVEWVFGDGPGLAQLNDGRVVEYTESTDYSEQGGEWEDYEYLGEGEVLTIIPPEPGSLSERIDEEEDEWTDVE